MPAGGPALLEALSALEAWGAARAWTGTDPYDGLNARRLSRALGRFPNGRRLLTQVVKRSPIDPRRGLRIRPEPSAAALGLVASAYALDRTLPADASERRLREVLGRLRELRCAGYAETCWGYHFDVHTRVLAYPRGAPNTIATAFAGLGVLDAYERLREEALLSEAASVGEFFVRHVPQTETPEGAFFGYLAGDRTPIHNASMLVAATLARLAAHTGRQEWRAAAASAVAYTLARQRPDGSWPYGELPKLDWVDGFHTGYVLGCLLDTIRAGARVPGDEEALRRGLSFYRDRLFLPDGTPKYTDRRVHPIDSQCVAQGIQTFARAADVPGDSEGWAWRVFDFAQRRMRRPDGAFIFQRRRLWANRTPHLRWTQAPMFLALVHLSRAGLR